MVKTLIGMQLCLSRHEITCASLSLIREGDGFEFSCVLIMSGADLPRLAMLNLPLARTGPSLTIRNIDSRSDWFSFLCTTI
jgi:hypothetical protein